MDLSEKGGSAAFFGCKPICEDAQAQGITGLVCEGPSNPLSSRMGWALKESERSGPKSYWEEGQPSKGAERASCDNPSNLLRDGAGLCFKGK